VGCTIHFVGANGKPSPVFETTERIASLQRGSFQAEEDGKLVLSLDNSFSYLKQKVVMYDFEVVNVQLSTQSSEDLTAVE